MKKSILSIGKSLSKNQQKQINGGFGTLTHEGDQCGDNNGNGSPNGCHCASNAQCASKICSINNISGNYYGGTCVSL